MVSIQQFTCFIGALLHVLGEMKQTRNK